MQILKVLRGCFFAYFFGVSAVWLTDLNSRWDGFQDILAYLDFVITVHLQGAIAAGIVTVMVLVLWLGLAYWKTTVAWWAAPAVAGLILMVGLITLRINLNISQLTGLILFSCATGIVFWLAAFGRNTRVLLTYKP